MSDVTGGEPIAFRGRTTRLIVFLGLILISFFSVQPSLFPNLRDINPWDEANAIHRGKLLAEGHFPVYAGNPAVSALYAAAYAVCHRSPHWLIETCTLSRWGLFLMIWAALILLALKGEERGWALAWSMAALFAVSPILKALLDNASDALYAVGAALALWQLIAFGESRKTRHLWGASLFLSGAALTRQDGFLLFLAGGLWLFWEVRHEPASRGISGLRRLAAYGLPFALVLGGFLATQKMVTGTLFGGFQERSYCAFEQGEGAAFPELYPGGDCLNDGVPRARALYGTFEENRGSIGRAIRRHPRAFLRRAAHAVAGLPRRALEVYSPVGQGILQYGPALLLFLLAARGGLRLIRGDAGSRSTLFLLLVWLMPLSVYVLTWFRKGYFSHYYAVVFLLAAIGMKAGPETRRIRDGIWAAGGALLMLAVAGLWKDLSLAQSAGVWLALAGLLLPVTRRLSAGVSGLWPALVVLTLVSGPYLAVPKLRAMGVTPDERACAILRAHCPPASVVGAWAPAVPLAAGQRHGLMIVYMRGYTDADFIEWLRREKIEAIYVDPPLRQFEPHVFDLVTRHTGTWLQPIFSEGDVQVLRVKTD